MSIVDRADLPEIVLFVARADNGIIGADGALPWRLPGDLKRFKAMTMGHPMVMGRKTFETFRAPLPGRRHIVLTRDGRWRNAGAEVAHGIGDAIMLADDAPVLAVIGGAQIYALFLPHATRIELTEVHAAPAGDTRLAPFAGWHEAAREDHPAEGGRPAYSFVTLTRRP